MNTTYMPNPQKVERKWYVVDAEGQTLGRLASEVAKVLRGKNKPIYTPHEDCGEARSLGVRFLGCRSKGRLP